MLLSDVYQCIEENNTQQILPIIKYIEDNFPSATFDEYNSEKSHIPTWRIDKMLRKGAKKSLSPSNKEELTNFIYDKYI